MPTVAGMGRARRALPAGLALAAAIALGACGSGGGDGSTASGGSGTTAGGGSGEKVNVAFFGLAADNTYTQSMLEQAKADAKEIGAEVQFFDGKWDGAIQGKQVQDAITSGRFRAFIIMPNDAPSLIPIVRTAIAKEIAVAGLEYPIATDPASVEPQLDGLATQVIEDVVVGARTVAEGVNRACEAYDPCEVGMLWGSRKLPTDAVKVPVFKETLDPSVKLVAEADANYLTAEGDKVASDMLQAHSGLDVFVTVGDQMAIGAQRAVERSGRELGNGEGKVTIIGYGATDRGVEAIRQGKWMEAYALVPRDMASKALELVVKAARGEQISDDERSVVQTSLSEIGTVASRETLEQHPDFTGQYTG